MPLALPDRAVYRELQDHLGLADQVVTLERPDQAVPLAQPDLRVLLESLDHLVPQVALQVRVDPLVRRE